MTTGGTGKTPLAIYTAKKISELGWTPIILSRGYGRPGSGIERIVSPGEPIKHPVPSMGDEPALIRRHVPEAWFGISTDRYSVGKMIETRTAKAVFILDDGFQHRKLYRDLDLVIIDPIQTLKSNRMLPRGTLREPVSGLRRSHAIILNTVANSSSVGPAQAILEELRYRGQCFYCEQTIENLVPFEVWRKADNTGSASSRPESVFLAAALANPERFHADVRKLGIRVCGTRFYRDHYAPRTVDWARCADAALKAGADAILVTEKDAIKISQPPDCPLLVAVQTTRFPDENAFIELLRRGIDASRNVAS